MRSLADELAATGKLIGDDELSSYITVGLDMEYQPLISANDARTEPISLDDLFAQMSGGSCYCEQPHNKGKPSGGGNSSGGNSSNSGGGGWPFYNNNRGRRNSSGKPREGADVTHCQICGKPGHTARDCWYRFEEDKESSQDEKVAAAAEGSYGVDTNWYVDSGATNHITGDLEKVTVREKYCG
ncbi:uncharacterized protein [Aegilops tauschii subsp. strangulata]|uniref:uncharacterized protein n=1 Tax=Aegilops tauschii subsp. strangulata TaxID=200361 RepID=UPI003CC84F84